MTSKRSNGNEEEPVKEWQLNVIQSQVTATDKVVAGINGKLDTILTEVRARPTTTEVDAKIELAVKNAVEKQDLKYAPMVQTNKLLLGGLVTTGLGLIGSLIMLVITLVRQP